MALRNRISLSLAPKLSLVFFSLFILAVGTIFLVVVPQLEARLVDQKRRDLENYAVVYSENFASYINQGASPVYLDLLAEQYAERADARIMLVNLSGSLMADSHKGEEVDLSDYRVANVALVDNRPATDVIEVGGRDTAVAAAPLMAGNLLTGVIVVSSSTEDVEASVSMVQGLMLRSAAGALILALITIYAVSLFLARRIRKIESGAKRIAHGDFGTRIGEVSRDELGQLALAFDDMGGRLGDAFDRIELEKRRAQLLLDDLSEGVLGVDGNGDVIVANPASEELLGKKIDPPVPLAELVPEEILELWESMDAAHPVRSDTFVLPDEQALQARSSFLSDQGELSSLVVLRDVSQEMKLEQSRRDFIANASHELKTPLFSISGFLELLQDEEVDEETKKEFVATMKEQVDRLARLARNLLDLSQLDSGSMNVVSSCVPLREVVESVAGEFSPPFVREGPGIDFSGLPGELVAVCDRERTAQLVRILLDNALKYSPEDGSIEVTGAVNGGSVSFSVTDHGPGIPREELPRIFERFYRGKGAGRTRGTGLGLSIAAELARLMEGSIEVKSGGGGTTFKVTLPAPGPGETAGA
ncbi:MAG: HAMP domain-containing protein [Gaiellales bacterium]|nr:MAG: HAMP domain-containing protein [Gaiellales bacterium]